MYLISESLHTYSPATYVSVFIFDPFKNFFFELLEAVVSKVKSMNWKAKSPDLKFVLFLFLPVEAWRI